ncbi:hypothetical protein CVT26_012502 [Gymnopilus dilepis]|uniref:Helicase ATP-binding domain-containing protein n=1 Tax=Gymnopilus dilepis TaxID=231916 RepID=A0A409YW40_9AGAR|nr:hypothetical protein CVT26_012502 [Gymnopilus dilepis]
MTASLLFESSNHTPVELYSSLRHSPSCFGQSNVSCIILVLQQLWVTSIPSGDSGGHRSRQGKLVVSILFQIFHYIQTCLYTSYTTDAVFPLEYAPSVVDSYAAQHTVDGVTVTLGLFDTAGQTEFDRLRPLAYPQTDVFLICFSLVDPNSFEHIMTKWYPEIIQKGPESSAIVLVGTKLDLREHPQVIEKLADHHMSPISYSQGFAMARGIGVPKYCECSAFTREGEECIRRSDAYSRLVSPSTSACLVHDSREWADFPWTSKSSSVKSQESDMYHRLKPSSYSRSLDVPQSRSPGLISPTFAATVMQTVKRRYFTRRHFDSWLTRFQSGDSGGLWSRQSKCGYYCHFQRILAVFPVRPNTHFYTVYRTSDLPAERFYLFVVFDGYAARYTVDGVTVTLGLFDTAGHPEYDRLRPLSYPQTDLFLICFSLVDPNSYEHVRTKWYPEIVQRGPRSAAIVLVGTKLDLREDLQVLERLSDHRMSPISYSQGSAMARGIGVMNYFECSAFTRQGVKSVFEEAIRLVDSNAMNNGDTTPYNTARHNNSSPSFSNILQPTTFPLNVYNTPRKRKAAPVVPGAPARQNPPKGPRPWPRLGRQVPLEVLEAVTYQIFGYKPHDWQLKLTVKVLEGHDVIGLAGTGRGKSLIFAMLAIAAALADFKGVVIVICPLKSLENDQVRRFDNSRSITIPGRNDNFKVTAVAINEDNHEESIFASLEKGSYRICYASPEILLRNSRFKQLFRTEEFRKKVVAMVVDEAHVIEAGKKQRVLLR